MVWCRASHHWRMTRQDWAVIARGACAVLLVVAVIAAVTLLRLHGIAGAEVSLP